MISISFCVCLYFMLYVCLCNNLTTTVSTKCTFNTVTKEDKITKHTVTDHIKPNVKQDMVEKHNFDSKIEHNITDNFSEPTTQKMFPVYEDKIHLNTKPNDEIKTETYDDNLVHNLTLKIKMHDVKHVDNTQPNEITYSVKYEHNSEHTTSKHLRTNKFVTEDDYVTKIAGNIIPNIQRRLDNEAIKKSLDEFSMIRRKTHFTLPDFNNNPQSSVIRVISKPDEVFKFTHIENNDIFNLDSDISQDIARPDIPNYYINNKVYRSKFTAATNADYDFDTNENNFLLYPTYAQEAEILNLLRRQTDIIQKLAKTMEVVDGRRQQQHDFEALLKEVHKKQALYKKSPNYTAFTFETTTPRTTTRSTTTKKPTTIMTMFDETAIRSALKNDPYVNRILKMANRKREKYLRHVKEYDKNI